MDSFKYSEKEFNIRSELIANLTKKVVVDGEIEFIVHFQIIPDGKERKIKVNAIAPLDGQVWSLVLTIDTLIEHRDELGIEGDWKSYFTLLRRSILGDRNGKISLTRMKMMKTSSHWRFSTELQVLPNSRVLSSLKSMFVDTTIWPSISAKSMRCFSKCMKRI
mmetsp:Transcript_57581/g.65699  ORF Transcript_57581/g.65699 Transcript_57581/m.65699 type:complete len:163 (-) Transcript_57581:986-1474(-)